jgi:hypothetical protein
MQTGFPRHASAVLGQRFALATENVTGAGLELVPGSQVATWTQAAEVTGLLSMPGSTFGAKCSGA